jgi:hypothetical protein
MGLRPPKVMKNASVQQPLYMEPSPFPLSSRAKPRDLRFRDLSWKCFSTERSLVARSAVFRIQEENRYSIICQGCAGSSVGRDRSLSQRPASKRRR